MTTFSASVIWAVEVQNEGDPDWKLHTICQSQTDAEALEADRAQGFPWNQYRTMKYVRVLA